MKQTKLESLQKVSFKLIYDCSHNKNRFEGSNNKKIELIMLSSTSFDKLEPLQKAKVNETSQDYEQVDGFESLRKICTIHITLVCLKSGLLKIGNFGKFWHFPKHEIS